VSGQVVDMASEGQNVEPTALDYIHRHKTGALIRAAIRLGAILGDANDEASQSLDAYGEALGLAFQIADDIQDVTKSAQELGKTPGKDLAANKATFVSLYGLDAARRHSVRMGQEALKALAGWDTAAEPLRAIAHAIMESAQ
jgi:geranylgeranyl diphosphate synthase type II